MVSAGWVEDKIALDPALDQRHLLGVEDAAQHDRAVAPESLDRFAADHGPTLLTVGFGMRSLVVNDEGRAAPVGDAELDAVTRARRRGARRAGYWPR